MTVIFIGKVKNDSFLLAHMALCIKADFFVSNYMVSVSLYFTLPVLLATFDTAR